VEDAPRPLRDQPVRSGRDLQALLGWVRKM
jgi:hypothetical protein